MKRFFIILNCLCAICVASHAQRLNDLGLKMVKVFTVQEYSKGQPSKETKYVFGYDDENRMTSLDIITNGRVSESYMKKNNAVTKYENYLSKFGEYKFTTDRNGNIISIQFTCLDEEDGKTPNWKHVYTFDYEYDNKTRGCRLSRVSDDYSVYKSSTKSFIDISSWVSPKIIDIGGLYINGSEGKGGGFYVIDYDHPNDTNMSFYGILTSGIGFRSMDFDSLLLTEWINVRSPYFAKYTTDLHELYFHYDDKGNLIQVDKTWFDDVVWTISIEYLE